MRLAVSRFSPCFVIVCAIAWSEPTSFDDALFRKIVAAEETRIQESGNWQQALTKFREQAAKEESALNRAVYCYFLRERIYKGYQGVLPQLAFDRIKEGTAIADALWLAYLSSRELLALRLSFAHIEEQIRPAKWIQIIWPIVDNEFGREGSGRPYFLKSLRALFSNMLINHLWQQNPKNKTGKMGYSRNYYLFDPILEQPTAVDVAMWCRFIERCLKELLRQWPEHRDVEKWRKELGQLEGKKELFEETLTWDEAKDRFEFLLSSRSLNAGVFGAHEYSQKLVNLVSGSLAPDLLPEFRQQLFAVQGLDLLSDIDLFIEQFHNAEATVDIYARGMAYLVKFLTVYRLGSTLEIQRRFLDAAEKDLGTVFSVSPQNPYAVEMYAIVKYCRGDLRAARKLMTHLASRLPNNSLAYAVAAKVHLEILKQYQSYVQWGPKLFLDRSRLFPSSSRGKPPSRMDLSAVYRMTEYFSNAAIKSDQDSKLAAKIKSELSSMKMVVTPMEAATAAKHLSALDGRDEELAKRARRYKEGSSNLNQGAPPTKVDLSLRQDLEESVLEDAKNFEKHKALILYYKEKSRPRVLDKEYPMSEKLRDQPDAKDTLLVARAFYQLFVRRNRGKEVLQLLEEALRENPDSAPARVWKGYMFVKSGNRDEASKLWIQALKLDPKSVDAARFLYSFFMLKAHQAKNAGDDETFEREKKVAEAYLAPFLKTSKR